MLTLGILHISLQSFRSLPPDGIKIITVKMPQRLGLCFLRLKEIPKAIFCFACDQTEPCLESRSPLAGSLEYRERPQHAMELLHWAPQIPLVQPRDLRNSAKFTSIFNTAVTIFPNLIFLPTHLECAGSALSKTLTVT